VSISALSGFPERNELLSAVVGPEYKRLRAKLQRVYLRLGEVIYNANKPIQYVYFPETAVISLVGTMENGETVEVGTVGREGLVGIYVFLGSGRTSDRAIVQIEGSALKMEAYALREELSLAPQLHQVLLMYTQSLLVVISQSSACHQHHGLEQRLSRWLLTMQDHAQSDELQITQDSLAMLMGSRRTSVSRAAMGFQKRELIRYSRGRLKILNRRGLKAIACECYRVVRNEFEHLRTALTSAHPSLDKASVFEQSSPAYPTLSAEEALRKVPLNRKGLQRSDKDQRLHSVAARRQRGRK
jgi:CRP-like cAMP-binding protein